jgi:hypothetical protein
LSSVTVSHYWFSDPTMPLAVAPAVWFSRDGRCRLLLDKSTIIPALRVYLPLECCPANPSRRVATRWLLSWALLPYSTCEIEGPHDASLPRPLCSAFRVWLPSWRFTPFGLSPALFRAGSAPGIHPSKLLLSKKYPNVSARMHPHTVSLPCSRSASTKPTWPPRFLGFDLPESPWRPTCV